MIRSATWTAEVDGLATPAWREPNSVLGRPPLAPLRAHPLASILVGALLVRLLLLPFGHTWDTQTWMNVLRLEASSPTLFEGVRAPYAELHQRTVELAGTTRHGAMAEDWAYPPLLLLLYWPLGHLGAMLGWLEPTNWPVQPTVVIGPLALGERLLIRLPGYVGDLLAIVALRRLRLGWAAIAGYAFNPLVLLSSIWTFDGLVVASVLWGLVWAERGGWGRAGLGLGLGAAAKYIPALLLPALMLASWQTAPSTPGRARRVLRAALGGTLPLIVCLPALDGVLESVGLHAERFGGGLTLAQAWRAWSWQAAPDWAPTWHLYASSIIGGITLPLALVVAHALLVRRTRSFAGLPLAQGWLVVSLAFLVGSKLVNEPYVTLPLALGTVVVARTQGDRFWLHQLWVLAVVYAMINTPVWTFGASALLALRPEAHDALWSAIAWHRDLIANPLGALPYAALGAVWWLLAGSWCARLLSIGRVYRPTVAELQGSPITRTAGQRAPIGSWPRLACLLGMASLVLVGYGLGRVQDVREQARLSRDLDVDRYSLGRGSIEVDYERLGGASKPSIRRSDGPALLSINDWEPGAGITIDGLTYDPMRLFPRSSIDTQHTTIAASVQGDGWIIERTISLAEHDIVTVEEAVIARRAIRRVSVREPQVAGAGLLAQIDTPGTATFRTAGGGTALVVRLDDASARVEAREAGRPGVMIVASTDSPAPDQRVLLWREQVQVTVG